MTQSRFFAGPGRQQAAMRQLLARESMRVGTRFGISRRRFVTGAFGALAASAIGR